MRSVIIPAQVTTVEDKIAGSLSLHQILLLLIPIFWTGIVYVLFPKSMEFTLYKLPFIVLVLVASVVAAIRIKGKLIAQWVGILAKYNTRPKCYIANKNDTYLRTITYPQYTSGLKLSAKSLVPKRRQKKSTEHSVRDLLTQENILVNVKFAKKGNFVYVEKV